MTVHVNVALFLGGKIPSFTQVTGRFGRWKLVGNLVPTWFQDGL